MFQFSTKTEVNKTFKLSDLFKQINASKDARKEAQCIESITLTNVLSPTTLYCQADKSIKEIYIFQIVVNTRYVPELFIKELDANIKLHTLFCIQNDDYELSMLSYKSGTAKGKYWQTNWEANPNFDVPPVGSVPEMYKFILSKFFRYPPHEDEPVDDYIKRYNQLVKLDFQINSTTIAIGKETQSKKRFEYNARLKQYQEERNNLLTEAK